MGHTGTEKKNPFVMTIGFNKNDPEHVEVAEFLNSLPRKKAQYIVEAVRCYRQIQRDDAFWREDWREKNPKRDNLRENNRGDAYSGEGNTGKPLDTEAIRQIVLQILAERSDDKERVAQKTIPQPAILERTKLQTDTQDTKVDTAPYVGADADEGRNGGFDQGDLEAIFESLEALRG